MRVGCCDREEVYRRIGTDKQGGARCGIWNETSDFMRSHLVSCFSGLVRFHTRSKAIRAGDIVRECGLLTRPDLSLQNVPHRKTARLLNPVHRKMTSRSGSQPWRSVWRRSRNLISHRRSSTREAQGERAWRCCALRLWLDVYCRLLVLAVVSRSSTVCLFTMSEVSAWSLIEEWTASANLASKGAVVFPWISSGLP